VDYVKSLSVQMKLLKETSLLPMLLACCNTENGSFFINFQQSHSYIRFVLGRALEKGKTSLTSLSHKEYFTSSSLQTSKSLNLSSPPLSV